MGQYGMGLGFGFPVVGMLLSVIIWALLIAGVIWFIVSLARREPIGTLAPASSAPLTPLDILKQRYARGEITKEQYEQMKQDIGA